MGLAGWRQGTRRSRCPSIGARRETQRDPPEYFNDLPALTAGSIARGVPTELELLIVGAGPTGLSLAIEAARNGLRYRIVDRRDAPSVHSKALAVQPRTLEVFEDWRIADEAVSRGFAAPSVNLYGDGERVGRLEFESLDTPFPFPLILAQSETERLLVERLAEFGGTVEREIELVDFEDRGDCVEARLRGPGGGREGVEARWLAGCDGAHSAVRHGLALSFEGTEYPEEFVLGDVRIEWGLPSEELHGFFSGPDVVAAIPMGGEGRYRLVATRRRGEETGKDPDLAEFEAIVCEVARVEARLSDPDWLARFRLHRRMVDRFRVGRAFLAGDAAHIHSPVGGQGMNTGIQDAYNLGWKLGLVAAGLAGRSLLDSYDVERRPVAERILRGTDIATRMVVGQSAAARLLRRLVPPVALGQGWLTDRLQRLISQLDIAYSDSPIVSEARSAGLDGGPAPGERAPDGRLRATQPAGGTRERRLFELYRGPRHVLLGFLPEDPEALGSTAHEVLVEMPVRTRERLAGRLRKIWVASGRERTPGSSRVLADPDGSVRASYGVGEAGALYLIRPDGHVGWRGPLDPEAPLAFLERYRGATGP